MNWKNKGMGVSEALWVRIIKNQYKGAYSNGRKKNLWNGHGKQEDKKAAKKTPFYQTESTGGSVWVIKPGQTLQKHRHHNSDDIWIILQGEGIFYPEPDKEIPLKKGQVSFLLKVHVTAQWTQEQRI